MATTTITSSSLISPEKLGNQIISKKKNNNGAIIIGWLCEVCSFKNQNLRKYCELCTCPRLNSYLKYSQTADGMEIQPPYRDFLSSEHQRNCEEKWKQLKLQGWREEPTKNIWKNPHHEKIFVSPSGPAPFHNDYSEAKYGVDFFWNLEEVIDYVRTKDGSDGSAPTESATSQFDSTTTSLNPSDTSNLSPLKPDEALEESNELVSFKDLINKSDPLGTNILSKKVSSTFPNNLELLLSNNNNATSFDASSILSPDQEAISMAVERINEDVNSHDTQGEETIKSKYNNSQDNPVFLDSENEKKILNESLIVRNTIDNDVFSTNSYLLGNSLTQIDMPILNDQNMIHFLNDNKTESNIIISSTAFTQRNLHQDKSDSIEVHETSSNVSNTLPVSNSQPKEMEYNVPNSLQQKYGVKLTPGMPATNRKSLFSLALKFDLSEKTTNSTNDFMSGSGNINPGSNYSSGGPEFAKIKVPIPNNSSSGTRDSDGYSVKPPPPQTISKEHPGDKPKRINRHQSTMPFPPMMITAKQSIDNLRGQPQHVINSLPQPLPINDNRHIGHLHNNLPIHRGTNNLPINPPSSCVSTSSNSLMHLDNYKKALFQKHWKVLQEAGWEKLSIDTQPITSPHYGYGYVCPYGQLYWYTEYFHTLTRGFHYYLNEDELIHNVEYQCGEYVKNYPPSTQESYQYQSTSNNININNNSIAGKRIPNNDPSYYHNNPNHSNISKYNSTSGVSTYGVEGGTTTTTASSINNFKQQQQQQDVSVTSFDTTSFRRQVYNRDSLPASDSHTNKSLPVVVLSSDSSEYSSSHKGSEGYLTDDQDTEPISKSLKQSSNNNSFLSEDIIDKGITTTDPAIKTKAKSQTQSQVIVSDPVNKEVKHKSGIGMAVGGELAVLPRIGRPLGSLNKKPASGRRSSARPTRRPSALNDNSDCIVDEYEEIGLKAEDVESGKVSNKCLTQRLAWKGDGFLFKPSAHYFIGKRVRLCYDDFIIAVCVCYLPQRGRRVALWGVEHDDDDFEDLSFEEMEIGIKSYADAMAEVAEPETMVVPERTNTKKRTSTITSNQELNQPQKKKLKSIRSTDRLESKENVTTNPTAISSTISASRKNKKGGGVPMEEDTVDDAIPMEECLDYDITNTNNKSNKDEIAWAIEQALENASSDHQLELSLLESKMRWEMEMALERQKVELTTKFHDKNDDIGTMELDETGQLSSSSSRVNKFNNKNNSNNNLNNSNETPKTSNDSIQGDVNTLDNGRVIELWSEFVQGIHESRPDKRRTGDKRELVEIERGEDYPVRVTIKIFKQRNTTDSMSAFLRVLFKHAEQTHLRATNRRLSNVASSAAEKKTTHAQRKGSRTNRFTNGKLISVPLPVAPSNSTFRTVYVAEDAEDAGGLIRQWLNDYLAELKNYTVVTTAILGSSKKLATFRVFTSGGGVFLPSRLVVPKSDDQPINLETVSVDKDIEKQRQELFDLYRSTGKVYNQMMREGIPLPEAFASPLLIYYLRKGENGLLGSNLRAIEIKQAILDFDIDYTGALNDIIDDDEATYRRALCTFVKDCIYSPRTGPLAAMKSGFEIVSVNSHLDIFSWKQFQYFFVGRDVITPSDILKVTKFSDNSTDNFKKVFLHTVNIMTPDDARKLVRFCSGAPYLAFDTLINITMKPVAKVSNLPLATAFSCTTQLFVPFNDRFTSPETLLENLRNSFRWGEESEFHDTSVAPVPGPVISNTTSSGNCSTVANTTTTINHPEICSTGDQLDNISSNQSLANEPNLTGEAVVEAEDEGDVEQEEKEVPPSNTSRTTAVRGNDNEEEEGKNDDNNKDNEMDDEVEDEITN